MSQYAPKKPSAFNSFNITLATIVFVFGYFGAWYLPHWFKVWRLDGALIGVGRDGYREFDDEKLMKKLLSEARRLELPAAPDNFAIERQPYPPEELQKFSDTFYPTRRGKSIIIAYAAVIDAEWPLIGGSTRITFHRQRSVDMSMNNL